MKTVVLDDDPTGTQSASGVTVLLRSDADAIARVLETADSVYIQTNSRAIDEPAAVALVTRVRDDALEAGRRLDADIQFVLRGDSTLRGHVFAETEVFAAADERILFLPAFPDGGRTTLHGMHYVSVGGRDIPAHESEFAADPVFGFGTGLLADYVREKSSRPAFAIDIEVVRSGVESLSTVVAGAPLGSVIVPDAVTDDDITVIARAIKRVRAAGTPIVVRSAAPLAAALAGVTSRGLLPTPLMDAPSPTLLVCGSHTTAATAQLAQVAERWGESVVVDTAEALADAGAAAADAVEAARAQLAADGLAVVSSERIRSAEHNTLDHGTRIMAALTTAVRSLAGEVDVVVAKGGITSADVARIGLEARSAEVLGQVLPGVSVWRLESHGRSILYVVVPGNVGGPDTLVRVLAAVGHGAWTST